MKNYHSRARGTQRIAGSGGWRDWGIGLCPSLSLSSRSPRFGQCAVAVGGSCSGRQGSSHVEMERAEPADERESDRVSYRLPPWDADRLSSSIRGSG
uniref:Uncharacterized protein n=1 Tax=Setaria viridis TaxID=4556 RepID=A0A4U6U6D5_SETVI|nr:hypothetical protein SEVIR_6G214200v2 [Setaria viridis]